MHSPSLQLNLSTITKEEKCVCLFFCMFTNDSNDKNNDMHCFPARMLVSPPLISIPECSILDQSGIWSSQIQKMVTFTGTAILPYDNFEQNKTKQSMSNTTTDGRLHTAFHWKDITVCILHTRGVFSELAKMLVMDSTCISCFW